MRVAVKTRVPHFEYRATVDVDVEINPDDLHEDGWHHESECGSPAMKLPAPLWLDVHDALASLHRQAHPSQHADPAICHEEPCRSLTLAQIRGVTA